jgi:Domain of unknown function (DUF4232)
MNASTGRGRLVAVFLAGAALLMAGCSTSNASAGPAISRTSQASPSGLAATSPSATPSTPAGHPPCKSGAVSTLLEHGRVRGRMAQYRIEFLNVSLVTCTLHGFPGVTFSGGNYSIQVGPAARDNLGSPEHLVTLPSEGFAIAQISVVNAKKYPRGCRQTRVSGLLVRPRADSECRGAGPTTTRRGLRPAGRRTLRR